MHLTRANVRWSLLLGDRVPEQRVELKPRGFACHPPAALFAVNLHTPAISHRRLEALQQKERQPHLAARKIGRSVPCINQPGAPGDIGQDRDDFCFRNPLVTGRHAVGHAKKSDAGVGVGHAFGYQGKLGAGACVVHQHQFHAIADGTDRTDKVVADTRADQSGKVGFFLHKDPLKVGLI